MESVVVIAPHEYGSELGARLGGISGASRSGPDLWVVEDGRTRVYVDRNDRVLDELEPEALNRVLALVPDPVFYTVDFSDVELCKRVLEVLVDDPKLIVDNDHGIMVPGPELIRMFRARPDWDWRRDRVRPAE